MIYAKLSNIIAVKYVKHCIINGSSKSDMSEFIILCYSLEKFNNPKVSLST